MELRSVTSGIILIFAGLTIEIWRRKLKFDRINKFGVEKFSSFKMKLFSGLLDATLRGVSLVLAFGGALIILISY